MPIFELLIKAKLENITQFKPIGNDFRWFLKLKCQNCGEESTQWIYITVEDHSSVKGSRGKANLVVKCKFCSRENTISIIKDSIRCYSNDGEQFASIIEFECRGTEPIDFSPRGGFEAKSSISDNIFKDISLQEKEWVDYDEDGGEAVGIYNLDHKFHKIK